MDKNAIKKFAVWARKELIERVSKKALAYGITEHEVYNPDADSVNGLVLTAAQKKERKALTEQIFAKGYKQVMEEVAYTWFNRFCALRFMEVNGFLPSLVRVFTNDKNEFRPQLLTEALELDLPGLDKQKIYELKEANADEELYKYLLITQCNALNDELPRMFQRIEDYTELLFPDNLLREGSVIEQMITLIPEEDWQDAVQIIGWLYQYYNIEPKKEVFANLDKNIKIGKNDIPAATQLFTPDWIVRYMVENSLGRLVTSNQCIVNSGQCIVDSESSINAKLTTNNSSLNTTNYPLAAWKYYLPEAEQEIVNSDQCSVDSESSVNAKLTTNNHSLATTNFSLTTTKCIDLCMGSGHILAYLFDVLMEVYRSEGYRDRDAVKNIINNNLYGLDIDERAAQLAYFAVMMQGRKYDNRFLTRHYQPHIYAITESNGIDRELLAYFGVELDALNRENALNQINGMLDEMEDACEYGSLITVAEYDFALLRDFAAAYDAEQNLFASGALAPLQERLQQLIAVAETLAQKYEVVVTNPPYMGAGNMNPKLNTYIKNKYSDYKSDFFSAFIIRASEMTKPDGYCGFFTPYVWMFIQSYEKLRKYLYSNATIETLIQFEYSAFEEATVPVCTFVFKNSKMNKKGCYLRLVDFRGGMEVQRQKTLEAIANHNCGFYYEQCSDNFAKIPGAPVAYWVSESLLNDFMIGKKIKEIAEPKSGLSTTNNERFLRKWFEVSFYAITFNLKDITETYDKTRWFPLVKGGAYRKWYGNFEYVVDWEKNGQRIKEATKGAAGGRIVSPEYYFKEIITWSGISSGEPSMRYANNSIFGSGAKALLSNTNLGDYLAFLNSKVALKILCFLSPTLNYEAGHIGNLPVCFDGDNHVTLLTNQNISLSKSDWDSFETSWDFAEHPLLVTSDQCIVNRDGLSNEQLTTNHYPLATSVQCIVNSKSSVNAKLITNNFSLTTNNAQLTTNNSSLSTIAQAYQRWKAVCNARFAQLKANEEELNRIFIDIYGLQDELTPEVEDKDVTVHRIFDSKDDVPEAMKGSNYILTQQQAVKSLISYAVGCMFGRYSLDKPGLVYAGGEISDQWLEISGQYYLREVVEKYVAQELQRTYSMAEINVADGGDLPIGEITATRGAIFTFRSDAKSSNINSVQYCRGTSKKLYEGIRELSVNSQGIKCGAGNTAYDLCSPEILDAIASGTGSELVQRGWQDADSIDWQAIHCKLTTNHYGADKDAIIPISDNEYFNDDIVARFVEFIKTAFCADEKKLEENLSFIASALGGNGSARDVIRAYFNNGFYADHCKTYQKRPIYWLFDSGKKNGFKCLIYMHRYQKDTIARIRTDYLHEQQSRYRTAISDLQNRIDNAVSTGVRVKLQKQLATVQAQVEEARLYEEKIHHLADQMLGIDLDDGVKHNYAIFKDVLARIK